MAPLDFLDAQSGEPADEPVIEAEQPVEQQPEGPQRGPDGKFVSREAAQAEPQPEIAPQLDAEPAPQAAPQADPQVAGLLKALADEREEKRRYREQLERQQSAAPPPDRYEDPEGYEAHREQQFEQRLLNERLNNSERFAKRDHGAETVATAKAWALEKFQSDPLYQQRVLTDADPYEAVVQDWKREQVLSTMKDGDLDAFLAWKSGQPGAPAPQNPAAPAAPPVVAPPRSLASAPSAGGLKPGEQPVGPGVAYNSIFKG